eukprot:321220_1
MITLQLPLQSSVSRQSKSRNILEYNSIFQSKLHNPLYFSNKSSINDYLQAEQIDIFNGYPISQFIVDAYFEYYCQNPDHHSIADFLQSSKYYSSKASQDEWKSAYQHLTGYTNIISRPINRNIFDSYAAEFVDIPTLYLKYQNTQERILYYISEIGFCLRKLITKINFNGHAISQFKCDSDDKIPHQLDVFFVPHLVDKINDEYFTKHGIIPLVTIKGNVEIYNSEIYKSEIYNSEGNKSSKFNEISRTLRNVYLGPNSSFKRYIMLIMSPDIKDCSKDEIYIFEPSVYNKLPKYHVNETSWIYNTKQGLPGISWNELNALCISFHEHQELERIYFSTMLPNNAYYNTRLYTNVISDILEQFCCDSTNVIIPQCNWISKKIVDPQYDKFIQTYFPDQNYEPTPEPYIDINETTPEPCIDDQNYEPTHQVCIDINELINTKEEYENMNKSLAYYYKSLNVEYKDQFISNILQNGLDDSPLQDHLGKDAHPEDCTFLDFDPWFPVYPQFKMTNDEQLHNYIFYFLQYYYLDPFGRFPASQYMAEKMNLLDNIIMEFGKGHNGQTTKGNSNNHQKNNGSQNNQNQNNNNNANSSDSNNNLNGNNNNGDDGKNNDNNKKQNNDSDMIVKKRKKKKKKKKRKEKFIVKHRHPAIVQIVK